MASAWQLARSAGEILATMESAAADLEVDPENEQAQADFAAAEEAFLQWSDGDVPAKVEALAIVAGELDARADWHRLEAQRAATRKRNLTDRANKLRNMQLELHQVWCEVEGATAMPLEGGRFARVRVTTSKRVEITDAEALTADYVKVQLPTPDKAKIAKALKAGVQVVGAELLVVERAKVVIK